MEGWSSGEYSLPGNDLEDYMNGKQKKVNEIRLPQILHIVQQQYFMGTDNNLHVIVLQKNSDYILVHGEHILLHMLQLIGTQYY